MSFWAAPCSHSPPLISVFLHLSWWVLSESCQGICVCPPSSPHYSPWGAPTPPSPLRVSPSDALMCSAASWRISLATVVTADDAPSSSASCCPLWWTTRRMLDSKVRHSELGEREDRGWRRYEWLQGEERWLWGISINITPLRVMRVEHMQAWNTHSNILSVSFLHQQIKSSQSEPTVSGYVCALLSTTCIHTLISVGPVKHKTA